MLTCHSSLAGKSVRISRTRNPCGVNQSYSPSLPFFRQHLYKPLAPRQHQIPRGSKEATETTEKEKWWNKGTAANMRDVNGVQELVDSLADAGDKLVIVEFYAPWCNACKALYPKVCKMMNEHLDDVSFLKVSFDENKDMAKNMGVKVLPFFQFYRGSEGKVTQFSCSVSKIDKLKEAIIDYSGLDFCSLEEPPALSEFSEVHPSEEHHHPDADKITKLAWS